MRRELRTVDPDRGGGGYVEVDSQGVGHFTGAAAQVFAAIRDMAESDDQLAKSLIEQGWSNGYIYLGPAQPSAGPT